MVNYSDKHFPKLNARVNRGQHWTENQLRAKEDNPEWVAALAKWCASPALPVTLLPGSSSFFSIVVTLLRPLFATQVCVIFSSLICSFRGSWFFVTVMHYYFQNLRLDHMWCADDPKKVNHLLNLDGAKERLHLVKANLLEEGSFDSVVQGCHAVFHTASPFYHDVKDPQVCFICNSICTVLFLSVAV